MYFLVCSCRSFSMLYSIYSVSIPQAIYVPLLMWIVTIMDRASMDI